MANEDPETIERGHLTIDKAKWQMTWKGRPVTLTETGFLLVCYLAENPGYVRTRDSLIDAGWGVNEAEITERAVDTQIRRIRKAFRLVDPEFKQIDTLYGIGYRWNEVSNA